MQADILKQINSKQCFSFSAPTSTGKSFVFRNLITKSQKDIVVVVPSRALINEYHDKVCNAVDVKEVNVLTFVDRINTKHAKRNVFILTPERARELFKNKSWLDIEYGCIYWEFSADFVQESNLPPEELYEARKKRNFPLKNWRTVLFLSLNRTAAILRAVG